MRRVLHLEVKWWCSLLNCLYSSLRHLLAGILCLSSRRKQDEHRGHVCSFLLCAHLSVERATQTWGSGWNCQIIAQQLGESVCLPALVGSSCGLTEQENKNRLEAMKVSREKYLQARQSFLEWLSKPVITQLMATTDPHFPMPPPTSHHLDIVLKT